MATENRFFIKFGATSGIETVLTFYFDLLSLLLYRGEDILIVRHLPLTVVLLFVQRMTASVREPFSWDCRCHDVRLQADSIRLRKSKQIIYKKRKLYLIMTTQRRTDVSYD